MPAPPHPHEQQLVLACGAAIVGLADLLVQRGLVDRTEVQQMLQTQSDDLKRLGAATGATYLKLMADTFAPKGPDHG